MVEHEQQPEVPGGTERPEPEPSPAGALVVHGATSRHEPARRWPPDVAALVTRLRELARDPAVVATTTTVGAALAARVLRQALRAGAAPALRRATPVVVTGHVVIHHVHVVHHVVHHVSRPALPPAAPGRPGQIAR